jgi:elongation factor G
MLRPVCAAVCGSHGAGKTTYLEHLLLRTGVVDRLGKMEDGTSHLAADPEEVRHGMSLSLAVATVPTDRGPLFFLDCPGEPDFAAESVGARSVADLALICVAADGEPGPAAVAARRWALEAGLPVVVALTRLDRPNARFATALEHLAAAMGGPAVPLALPLGEGEGLSGVVDLLTRQHFGPEHGRRPATEAELKAAGAARAALEEAAAEGDDDLLAAYLESGSLADEEVALGVAERAAAGPLWVVPVCAPHDLAVDLLAEAVRRLAPPQPAPAAADGAVVALGGDGSSAVVRVFKTMADPYVGRLSLLRVLAGELRADLHVHNPGRGHEERLGQLYHVTGRKQVAVPTLGPGEVGAVAKLAHTGTGDTLCADSAQAAVLAPLAFPDPLMRMAVTTGQQASEDKLGPALARLSEEDPSLHSHTDPETDELLLEGLGETHLEVAVERLARKFGVQATLQLPQVPYRETVRAHARAEFKHKKQSGGHGQYGHVVLEIEPYPDGEFLFADKIFGGVVPHQYRPAVEKGVRESMHRGVLAAYPVTGVKVTLVDGSYHSVDSSEMAFKIASAMAFDKGCRESTPVLLEPVLEVEVECPEAYAGAVMEDLQKKRARILGMAPEDGLGRIRAHVPQAEMLRYPSELRSLTGGWGRFRARPDHYAEAPAQVADRIVAARQALPHAAGH